MLPINLTLAAKKKFFFIKSFSVLNNFLVQNLLWTPQFEGVYLLLNQLENSFENWREITD